MGIDFIILDKARGDDYQKAQRAVNRHTRRHKANRKLLKDPKGKQLDWDRLLERAKVWVRAYVVHDNEIRAIREKYSTNHPDEPQLTRADRYVLKWYTKFKPFNDALL